MIRVLIVEDSPVMAQILKGVLESDSQLGVVGVAKDGLDALALTKKYKPDVITMDIHMPRMDGLEATKQIMAYCATPILILSSSVFREGTDKAFRALSYGAVDVLEKNIFETDPESKEAGKNLIEKVKLISRIHVISHPLAKIEERRKPTLPKIPLLKTAEKKIIGIVASTGGPQILLAILKLLPHELPCPIVVVQHISAGFTEGLVEWLDRETFLSVKIATNHEELRPGTVYVAPPAVQMLVTSTATLSFTQDKSMDGQKPSGTLLFESIAKTYGSNGLGILLTGMGTDGALGLKAIYEAKGHTLVQNEKSCTIYGMPHAAVEMGVVDEVLSPDEIALEILKWVIK